MRVDKFIQLTKQLSKQDIKELFKHQDISINREFITSLKQDVTPLDKVYIKEELITEAPYVYIMMNKPKGVLSALKDEYEKTVLDLIDHPRKDSLRIMGRLDRDTTGLMILTNDNRLIKRVTLPDYHVEKEYEVVLRDPICKDAIKQFADGIMIDQNILLKPAHLKIIDDTHVKLTISEGRYHQVKKMFLSISNEVIDLKRIRIHYLCLDPSLKLGSYKELSSEEIAQLIP